MSKVDTYGPAFPTTLESAERLGCTFTHEDVGLTKRDWFAGQAMAGITSSPGFRPSTAAKEAYAFADAMLAERAKGGAA